MLWYRGCFPTSHRCGVISRNKIFFKDMCFYNSTLSSLVKHMWRRGVINRHRFQTDSAGEQCSTVSFTFTSDSFTSCRSSLVPEKKINTHTCPLTALQIRSGWYLVYLLSLGSRSLSTIIWWPISLWGHRPILLGSRCKKKIFRPKLLLLFSSLFTVRLVSFTTRDRFSTQNTNSDTLGLCFLRLDDIFGKSLLTAFFLWLQKNSKSW